jgi:hypothetical protein
LAFNRTTYCWVFDTFVAGRTPEIVFINRDRSQFFMTEDVSAPTSRSSPGSMTYLAALFSVARALIHRKRRPTGSMTLVISFIVADGREYIRGL